MLLETGKVNVDSKDNDSWTPLWWAAGNGHEAVVKMLLDTGNVDVDSKDNDGRTPLLWAAKNGHEAVVKMLLKTGNIDAAAEDVCGLTALQLSAFNHHGNVERLLLGYNVPIASDFYGLQSLFCTVETEISVQIFSVEIFSARTSFMAGCGLHSAP